MAPNSWALYLQPALRHMAANTPLCRYNLPMPVPGAADGVQFRYHVSTQCFADDTTAYSSAAAGIAAQTSSLKAFFDATNGMLNVQKTQLVVQKHGEVQDQVPMLHHPEIISTTATAKYLGSCTPASDAELLRWTLELIQRATALATSLETAWWLLQVSVIPKWAAAASTGGSSALLANAATVDSALAEALVAASMIPRRKKRRTFTPRFMGGYGVPSFEEAVSSALLTMLGLVLGPSSSEQYAAPPAICHWYALQHVRLPPHAPLQPAHLARVARELPAHPLAAAYSAAATAGLTVHVQHSTWCQMTGGTPPASHVHVQAIASTAAWPAHTGPIGVDGSVLPALDGLDAAGAAALPEHGAPLVADCTGLALPGCMSSFVPEALACIMAQCALSATPPQQTPPTLWQDNQAVIATHARGGPLSAWVPSVFTARGTLPAPHPQLTMLLHQLQRETPPYTHRYVPAHRSLDQALALARKDPTLAPGLQLNAGADVLAGAVAAQPATTRRNARNVTQQLTALLHTATQETIVMYAGELAIPLSRLRRGAAARWQLPLGSRAAEATLSLGLRAVQQCLSHLGTPPAALVQALPKPGSKALPALRLGAFEAASALSRFHGQLDTLNGLPVRPPRRAGQAHGPRAANLLAQELGVRPLHPVGRPRYMGPDRTAPAHAPDARWRITAPPTLLAVNAALTLGSTWLVDEAGLLRPHDTHAVLLSVSSPLWPCALCTLPAAPHANWPRLLALRAHAAECPPDATALQGLADLLQAHPALSLQRATLPPDAVEALTLAFERLRAQDLCSPWSAKPHLLRPTSYSRAGETANPAAAQLRQLLATTCPDAEITDWTFVEQLQARGLKNALRWLYGAAAQEAWPQMVGVIAATHCPLHFSATALEQLLASLAGRTRLPAVGPRSARQRGAAGRRQPGRDPHSAPVRAAAHRHTGGHAAGRARPRRHADRGLLSAPRRPHAAAPRQTAPQGGAAAGLRRGAGPCRAAHCTAGHRRHARLEGRGPDADGS